MSVDSRACFDCEAEAVIISDCQVGLRARRWRILWCAVPLSLTLLWGSTDTYPVQHRLHVARLSRPTRPGVAPQSCGGQAPLQPGPRIDVATSVAPDATSDGEEVGHMQYPGWGQPGVCLLALTLLAVAALCRWAHPRLRPPSAGFAPLPFAAAALAVAPIEAATPEEEVPIATTQVRRVKPHDFVLESVMLQEDLDFETKMQYIGVYYNHRPLAVVRRVFQIGAIVMRALRAYQRGAPDKADVLRRGVVELGVVYIKVAQTLATRPDIIGDEAAQALSILHDDNPPFPNKVAYRIVADDLNWSGPVSPHHRATSPGFSPDAECLFAELSESPIAAASIAQVYKGRTRQGIDVAVKVRRPGVVQQVALDNHCLRLLLRALKVYGVLSEQTDITGLTDEVGSGLFRELDLVQEARNAAAFALTHRRNRYLRVPRCIVGLTSTRVLTQEWIAGAKVSELPVEDQERMIRYGLDTCFTQMLRTGFIHADPHYGNMMFTPEKQLVLLDFGLVTRADEAQRDAMALTVLHTLSENWRALVDDFRQLRMIPREPALWVDRKTQLPISGLEPGMWKAVSQQEFLDAFQGHLVSTGAAAALANGGRRRSFSQLTQDLYLLSLSYRFLLPSWMIFIIRAVVTLDGFAAQIRTPVNAVEAAFPHAVRRLLTPQTPEAQAMLTSTLLTPDGDLQWTFLEELAVAGATTTGTQPPVHFAPPEKELADSSTPSSLLQSPSPSEAKPSVASAGPAPTAEAPASTAAQETLERVVDVLRELLYTPDGSYFRHLLCRLNSPAILRRLLLLGTQQLLQGPSPELERVVLAGTARLLLWPLEALRRGRSAAAAATLSVSAGQEASVAVEQLLERALGSRHAIAPDDASPDLRLPPYPAPPPPPTAPTQRRVHRALLAAHLGKLLRSPSGIVCLLAVPALWLAITFRALAGRLLRCLPHRQPRPPAATAPAPGPPPRTAFVMASAAAVRAPDAASPP